MGKRKYTIGADPEFEMVYIEDGDYMGKIYAASEKLRAASDERVGKDGSGRQVELRPLQSTHVKGFMENIKKCLINFNKRNPQYTLSSIGDLFSCGGHIHFGDREVTDVTLYALDGLLGGPLSTKGGWARGKDGAYGKTGDHKAQAHGWEWRTPPAFPFTSPELFVQYIKAVKQIYLWTQIGKIGVVGRPLFQQAGEAQITGKTPPEVLKFAEMSAGVTRAEKADIVHTWGVRSDYAYVPLTNTYILCDGEPGPTKTIITDALTAIATECKDDVVYIRPVRGTSDLRAHQVYPVCAEEGLYQAVASLLEFSPTGEQSKGITRARVGTSIGMPKVWLKSIANTAPTEETAKLWELIALAYKNATSGNQESLAAATRDAVKNIATKLKDLDGWSDDLISCFQTSDLPDNPFIKRWQGRKEKINCADSLAI
jgi:hypothetical protein